MGMAEQLWVCGRLGTAMGLNDSGSCFVDRDGGFTSIGVVVAMTLVVTLLFTSSQIYWINSTAGDIRFAADAGALAAENVVGEYLIVPGRRCRCVVHEPVWISGLWRCHRG